jgi:hypothetical protein
MYFLTSGVIQETIGLFKFSSLPIHYCLQISITVNFVLFKLGKLAIQVLRGFHSTQKLRNQAPNYIVYFSSLNTSKET